MKQIPCAPPFIWFLICYSDRVEASHPIYSQSHVLIFYIINAAIVLIPSILFFALYCSSKQGPSAADDSKSEGESLSPRTCTSPLAGAIVMLFLVCLLFFGAQDTYGNMLTTFLVSGPLRLGKPEGVQMTSLYWAASGVGRFNGTCPTSFICSFILEDLRVNSLC